MNEELVSKSIRIRTYLFNSYYSYRHPNLINDYIKGDFKSKDSISYKIYSDLHEDIKGSRLDILKEILNIQWNIKFYNNKNSGYILFDLARKLSNEFICIKNGQLHIKWANEKSSSFFEVGKNYNNKFQWYILKQLINSDLLIATYLIDNKLNSESDMALWDAPIFTSDTLLDKVLSKGVAELHMHIGASKRFDSIWVYLMNNKKENSIKNKEKSLENIKITTYEGTINFGEYINTSKIIRLIISIFLMNKDNIQLKNFIKTLKDIDRNLNDLITSFIKGERLDIIEINFNEIFDKLKDRFNYKYEELDTSNDSELNSKEYLNNIILGKDIVTYVLNDFYIYDNKKKVINVLYKFDSIILPENILIFKSLRYLVNQNFKDELFSTCFWQYIKIKNIFFTYIVQQKMNGKGLDIFSQIYSRQASFKNGNLLEESFYSEAKNQNIKKFEIRYILNKNVEKIRNDLINLFKVYRNILKNDYFFKNNFKSIPLIGIVFSFNKNNKFKNNESCFFKYKNTKKCDFLYKGKEENEYLKQARILSFIRKSIPNLDYYIVGIDAASKEFSENPFVFKKSYEYLRSINSIRCENGRNSFINEIGFTYHVGEEFRDVISGLRHIDEVIEVLKFESGDRIGHGIVLGIDIDKWAENNPIIYMKVEDYLDNLLWEWGLCINDRNFKDFENINYLENKIYEVLEYIFGFTEGLNIRDIYKSYKKKIVRDSYCDYELELNEDSECKLKEYTEKKYNIDKDKFMNHSLKWNSYLICKALNCKYFLEEMNKTVKINIDRETIEKSKKLQNYMKKKISDRQIVLELNPTSNIYIGEFKSFKDYHILNLSSPKKENVIVTINTDDPVIFNTKINNEYSLIYDIMMSTGEYESKEIIDWLDKIRLNGLEYSFIKDRKLTADELELEIDKIIKDLENLDVSKLI